MKLTQGEKLILLALADQRVGRNDLDLDFIRKAILSGHTWALSWQLSGIAADDTDELVVQETADILSMWSYIERRINAIDAEDKEQLNTAVYPFSLEFHGFDGNNDKHFGVASFLIEDMGRFSEFVGRPLNSHSSSSLLHYRRMLPLYETAMREKGLLGDSLTADEIAKIIKAGHD